MAGDDTSFFFFISFSFGFLLFYVIINFYKNYVIIILLLLFFSMKIIFIFSCFGMFRHVPECSMFRVLSTPVEDRTSGGRKLVFWKVSWHGSRVSPLDHSQSITQTLTGKKKFVIKKKICHEQKVLSREKKIINKKLRLELY